MIHRLAYRAQFLEGREDEARARFEQVQWPETLVTLSAHSFRRNLFVYFECEGEDVEAERFLFPLNDLLEPIPFLEQKRHFARMADIFHYQAPVEGEAWRPRAMGTPEPMLIRLRPNMIGSYIFYHQQLQEERPGVSDKYGLIAMHENWLYFYLESPTYTEKPTYKGKLDTHNTPGDWSGLMDQHFLLWEDLPDTERWRKDLKTVFVKRAPDPRRCD